MTSAADIQRIMDMMAKVKNLAENAGTVGEAEAASEMLNKMLMKHNLSMADIKDVNDPESQEYGNFRFDMGSSYAWRKILLISLADTTFCHAVFDGRGSGANIVGQQHNVTVVEHMFEYLVEAVDRLADKAWAEVDPVEKMMHSARRWKYAFRYGAAQEIAERLRKRFRENMAEYRKTEGDSNAMVLVNDQLQSALAHYFPRLRSLGLGRPSDAAGHGAGMSAGSGVNLDSQVGAGRPNPIRQLAG